MKGFIARIILFAAAAILISTSLWAQSSACVFLKTGSGYAGKMRMKYGTTTTSWSGSFAINEHKCQSLKDVVDGTMVEVQVTAIAGETKTCGTFVLAKAATTSVTYLASGTTLNVSCSMPR
jgi:hypothetical protein